MKKELNKGIKVLLTIIAAAGVLAFSVLLYHEALNKGFEERKVPVYNYKSKPAVDYKVYFKPNMLYDDNHQGVNDVYIANYVDHIQPSFTYEFSGERTAEISGDYGITAVMEGYISENDKNKTIWKKSIKLMPQKNFKGREAKLSITEKIPIRFEEYNSFVTRLIEETKVGSQAKLTVYMDINLNVETAEGLIQEKYSPCMIIPLNVAYFEITKGNIEEKTGAIDVVKRVEVLPDKLLVVIYTAALFISLFILVFLLFFTKEAPKKDPTIRNMNRILKNYSSRLVALTHDIAEGNEVCYAVESFTDIIKIADEVEKPILYKYCSDIKDIKSFYVIDGSGRYVYKLKEPQSDIEGKLSGKVGIISSYKADNKEMVKLSISKEDSNTEDI